MIIKEWYIPAKTFLVGEYAVLKGFDALVLTTTPCFVLKLLDEPKTNGIHPESPAGVLWQQLGDPCYGLEFYDPYQGLGGLGASSAQFLGTFYAVQFLLQTSPTLFDLLNRYWSCAWQGYGQKPSGADLLAQTKLGFIHVDLEKLHVKSIPWPFDELGCLIVRTGNKLRTDRHLQTLANLSHVDSLGAIAANVIAALGRARSGEFIQGINSYHQILTEKKWVAPETLKLIQQITHQISVMAIKGCGAMGADMILIVDTMTRLHQVEVLLGSLGLNIVARLPNENA